MNTKFLKEIREVMNAAKSGISGNINLSSAQKKYIKNLLLFALMNASNNDSVTNKNFIRLVNKLFKGFLIKILKECLDDDDDTDFDGELNVELNKIIASGKLLNNPELLEAFTPENIIAFLKNSTNGFSQKDLIRRLMAIRDAKANYRETPSERAKRERSQKEYEQMRISQKMLSRGGRES